METLFPFGFPPATAFYLTLYWLTLITHVVPMNYVLAGSTYLAVATLAGRAQGNAVAVMLREWLPFLLGIAITAGVAPLLFIQILYKHHFYTANLLLFNRWMSFLPVLIVGFYLLYLFKSKRLQNAGWLLRFVVTTGAASAFMYTAWAWTENHLLSLNADAWTEHYAAGELVYRSAELAPRLTLWFVGAFPTLALLLGWQLWGSGPQDEAGRVQSVQQVSRLALASLAATGLAAWSYYHALEPTVRESLITPLAGPYVAVAGVGLVVQFVAWIVQRRLTAFNVKCLSMATVGLLMSLVGSTAVREARRLLAIDMSSYFETHAAAANMGGLPLFLAFFALNATLIGVATYLVVRSFRAHV